MTQTSLPPTPPPERVNTAYLPPEPVVTVPMVTPPPPAGAKTGYKT
jgi:hypothetical protein